MPDITGELGAGAAGTPTSARAVPLSGWFQRGAFAAMTGLSMACSVGSISYNVSGDFNWFLVGHSDRLIDWSYCGIPGGIPSWTTIHTTLGVPGQSPTYVQSVTAAQINSAITAASGNPAGNVVYLYPGTYNISGFSFGAVNHVVLRGAGAGQTNVNISSNITTAGTGGSVYGVTGVSTTGGCAKGATSINTSSTPPASAVIGRIVVIQEDADQGLYWGISGRTTGVHAHSARITGVSGNTISFTPPNPLEFPAGHTVVARFGNGTPTSLCGIEDMTIAATGFVEQAIWPIGAERFWMRDVEVTGFGGRSGLIRCEWSVNLEFSRCYVHDVYNFPNADGYGIYLWENNDHCKVEDCVFYHTGMAVLVANSSAHYIGYNYAWGEGRTTTTAGTLPSAFDLNHYGTPVMCLVEGNMGSWLTNDGVYGSSIYHSIFRNRFHCLNPNPALTGHRWPITLAQGSFYHNIIGNVLGDPSWTPDYYELEYNLSAPYGHFTDTVYKIAWPNDGNFRAEPDIAFVGYVPGSWAASWTGLNRNTAIIHGNYDYLHSAVHEWADADHAISASLYYSSKPSWFGNLTWPPIGPDVSGLFNDTPAKRRWDNYQSSGVLADLFADAPGV